jgi:hypothetical protein
MINLIYFALIRKNLITFLFFVSEPINCKLEKHRMEKKIVLALI